MMLRLLALAVAVAFPYAASAQLRLSPAIGDGMVMQRGAPAPVWGRAAPGAGVTVTFDGTPYAATADVEGAWRVLLPPMLAGGPHGIAVTSGAERRDVRDVLVGDVWVASGQSNMEWTVRRTTEAAAVIAGATDTQIRQFYVPHAGAAAPADTLAGGTWSVVDAAHVGDMTAVGYFFARDLRARVGVPIGILHASWGGSRIEPWMSAAALGYSPAQVDSVLAVESADAAVVRARVLAAIGTTGPPPTPTAWADPDLDDRTWPRIAVPSRWEQAGYPDMDGTAWYRTAVTLTAAEAHAGVRVGLGQIDETDDAFVNGVRVGGMVNDWTTPRLYDVPASILHAGRNTIAVRVQDATGGGGIDGRPEELFVEAGGRRRSLVGEWAFGVAEATVNPVGCTNQVPTLLYNQMIHPLLGVPVKGVLWYQGESNAGEPEVYRGLFQRMIADWRAGWGQPDLPFLFVQLPNYLPGGAETPTHEWARLRASQAAALALPATGMAVTIDVGDPGDIHPTDKAPVGRRLARLALRTVYGQDVTAEAPSVRNARAEGRSVVLTFTGALRGRGEGFEVAGADGRFVAARARRVGDTVTVESASVSAPQRVRYAWRDNPVEANLVGVSGLPVAPFDVAVR